MTKKDVKKKDKLFLIDGNGLAYRAFYAVTPMQTSSGIPVNAVAGFVDMVLRLLRTEKPTHVAVAFDKGVPTERVDAYQDYNAQRMEMPEDLALQLPIIEDFVRALGVPVFRVPGHEADDCIGTLSAAGAKQDMDVLILSGDLGLLQLVSPSVRVLTTRRGISDMVIYDEKSVKKRFNLKPKQLADLRALAGDSSDNITGVPGIGEVTAKKLLSQYGSLEDLLKSLSSLPAKWRNPLSENRQEALEFKERAAIRTDLELDVDWEKCKYSGVPVQRVGEIYQRMELNEVLEALPENGAEEKPLKNLNLLEGKKGKTALAKVAKSKKPLSLLFLGAGKETVGLAVADGDDAAYVVNFEASGLKLSDVYKALEPALTDSKKLKFVHNLRSLLMQKEAKKLQPQDDFFDVAVASHLLDSKEGNPWLDEIARNFGLDIPGEGELLGHGRGYRLLSEVPVEELSEWAGRRVLGLAQLGGRLRTALEESELTQQFREIEMPMVLVFAEIEREGVPLDSKVLDKISKQLESYLESFEKDIYEEAGQEFDLDEPKELAEVLFDKMGLAVNARPKNGAAIGNDILTQVADQSCIGLLIRDLRELRELKASFERSMGRFATPRNGWFRRQAQFPVTNAERILWMGPVAVGGAAATYNRLLSEIEGLPNSELRLEFSKLLLQALKSGKKNKVLLSCGYDQFQLRLAAHLAAEKELIRGYVRDQDVESEVTKKVYNGGDARVTDELRQDVVDSLLGSIGAYRLARRTGKTPEEANEMISSLKSRFFEHFTAMDEYFKGELEKVKSQGWVSSISGRRRNLPEMSSRNSDIRDTAERIAGNAAIQSSAADIIKKVMVRLHQEICNEELPARLVMQLRDSLVLEVDKSETEKVAAAVVRIMEEIVKLEVPLSVRVATGKSWNDMKLLKMKAGAR